MGTEPQIAILGAGVAGLCMAMQLRRAGIDGFTIFDKSPTIGGTWSKNDYPGAGCDVPSHLYCFSFEPNPDWSRKYAEQSEILAYLERCADKYQLAAHMRLATEVTEIVRRNRRWEITTADGQCATFDVVVTATGQLDRPAIPALDGLENFEGVSFHSARWRHDRDLSGDVAVVGNGASALQLIPHVAAAARSLTIYQRSAHWIVEKPDRRYTSAERWLFRHVPWVAKVHRAQIYVALEARFLSFRTGSLMNKGAALLAQRELDKVRDPQLRRKLTPNYAIGCKRILISNDYYDALQLPHVHVVTEPIERVAPNGIVTDGDLRVADTIIFGTGFESTGFVAPMEIVGRDGQRLAEAWRDGAEAYLGVTVAGFPNMFMLYGPNTNLGHSSIIFMIEAQTRYVLRCLAAMKHHGAREMEVTRTAMDRYNEHIQAALGETVWGTGCDNWYRHASGKITNNWGSFTTAYWWRTREPDLSAYRLR